MLSNYAISEKPVKLDFSFPNFQLSISHLYAE